MFYGILQIKTWLLKRLILVFKFVPKLINEIISSFLQLPFHMVFDEKV